MSKGKASRERELIKIILKELPEGPGGVVRPWTDEELSARGIALLSRANALEELGYTPEGMAGPLLWKQLSDECFRLMKNK